MNENDIKILTTVTCGNCVILGCFAALAVYFDKWWIVLFSILFWKGYKYSTTNNDTKKKKREGIEWKEKN